MCKSTVQRLDKHYFRVFLQIRRLQLLAARRHSFKTFQVALFHCFITSGPGRRHIYDCHVDLACMLKKHRSRPSSSRRIISHRYTHHGVRTSKMVIYCFESQMWMLTVAAGRGTGGSICPREPAEGDRNGLPKWGAVIFLRHEIYKTSVRSVEAEMGMEAQIICVEQCTCQMSSVVILDPQNAPNRWRLGLTGELTATPDRLVGFKGGYF